MTRPRLLIGYLRSLLRSYRGSNVLSIAAYNAGRPAVSETFVKTFKRDYVRTNPLAGRQNALRQINRWFEDYKENHPHSGLKMRSPREFIRALAHRSGVRSNGDNSNQ